MQVGARGTYITDVGPHLLEERLDTIDRLWVYDLAVIEPETDPEVIHEHGEPSHHRCHTPWSTELIPRNDINNALLRSIHSDMKLNHTTRRKDTKKSRYGGRNSPIVLIQLLVPLPPLLRDMSSSIPNTITITVLFCDVSLAEVAITVGDGGHSQRTTKRRALSGLTLL